MYRLLRRLAGCSRCRIDGADAGRLVMICRKRRIYMWNIHREADNMEVSVLTPDVTDLQAAAAVCGGRVTVLCAHGLPVLLKTAAAHKYFFAGLTAAVVFIYILSGYIWAVEVSGNSFYTDEVLSAYLKELDAGAGSLKRNIVPSEVEENIRLKYPRISWVSAKITGTKLKLDIEEGQPDMAVENDSLSEICAPYSGTVSSIMVRGGTALVAPGDTVKAGDVLVRGSVDIYGDDGAVADTINVAADADVVVRVKFKVDKSYDRHYMKKVYDGDVSKSCVLHLFGKSFELSGANKETEKSYDEILDYKAFRLTEDFYLPLAVTVVRRQSYVTEPSVYTKEEITAIGEADLERRLRLLTEGGGEIIENNTKIEITDSSLVLSGHVIADVLCKTSDT